MPYLRNEPARWRVWLQMTGPSVVLRATLSANLDGWILWVIEGRPENSEANGGIPPGLAAMVHD